MKKILAIIGDTWHASGPLIYTVVDKLRDKGYEADCIIDYNVPFDTFDEYELIFISRYGIDDVQCVRNGEIRRDKRWLTREQEEKFVDYVNNGGKLLIHHDGFAFYREGGGLHRLAKARFIDHPVIIPIKVKPVEGFDSINHGIDPFEIADEEYDVVMDETETNVFLESYSETHGRSAQGWYHDFGKGKVCVYIPGHDLHVMRHPMVSKGVDNVITWLID